jgi:hypothetical protein
MSQRAQLEELAGRLEAAAERLRGGGLDAEAAAALIEECAELAARAGSTLEAAPGPSGAPGVPPPGAEQAPLTGPRQDPLL